MTIRADKLRLYPNAAQRMLLTRRFGSARWTWNRALQYRSKAYQRRGESLSGVDFRRLLTRMKGTNRYGWLQAVPSTIVPQKLRDQNRAFRNVLEERARHPRFRKRGGRHPCRGFEAMGTGQTGELMRAPGKRADRDGICGEARPGEARIVISCESALETPANG